MARTAIEQRDDATVIEVGEGTDIIIQRSEYRGVRSVFCGTRHEYRTGGHIKAGVPNLNAEMILAIQAQADGWLDDDDEDTDLYMITVEDEGATVAPPPTSRTRGRRRRRPSQDS